MSKGHDAGVLRDYGCVAIRNADGWMLAPKLVEPLPLTLLAVASDDPDSWAEMLSLWPRYSSPLLPGHLTEVPFDQATLAEVRRAMEKDSLFVLIDLCQKRIATGNLYPFVGRDGHFRSESDDSPDGNQYSLYVHLPPWWELLENVDVGTALSQRSPIVERPVVDREFLYGDSMLQKFATALLKPFDQHRRDGWFDKVDSKLSKHDRRHPSHIPYELLIGIHRDWLMTPRDELRGRFPRQLLHGAHSWIDRLVLAQQHRFEDGLPIVAAPFDLGSVVQGPMGRSELVMYFDLCREIISAGWFRLFMTMSEISRKTGVPPSKLGFNPSAQEGVSFLKHIAETWLAERYEGGSPPRFIVECDRRRVPRGVDIPIEGITERETEERHPISCGCPVCQMVDEGLFGPCFNMIDGHHLELDEEFAFSAYETREEWMELGCVPDSLLSDDEDQSDLSETDSFGVVTP